MASVLIPLVEHETISMDYLQAARPSRQLCGTRSDDSLRERDTVRPDELDGRAGLELALAQDDADAEEGGTLLDEGLARTRIDVQTS
jgi:hypothetical protein